MRWAIRPTLVGALLVLALFGGTTSANGQTPIGPNQHFIGLVNGSNVDGVVVYTVCPGPASLGRIGPVAGGQTMSVAQVKNGDGYTGPLSQVYAWFAPAPGQTPTMRKFTEYGVPQDVPGTVRVPCEGNGQAEFSSCPYLAPCVYGFVPDFVNVKFVNIAV
jgi:hypothetical protein